MHILHLVHQYLPTHVGGTELYTQTLAQHQVQQGAQATVFYPAIQERRQTMPSGVQVFGAPVGQQGRTAVFARTFGHAGLRRAFKEVLQRDKPDVVHIQHLMGLPASLVDEVVEAGIPLVITLHDYWFPCVNAQLVTNYSNGVCGGPDKVWGNCARCVVARSGRVTANLILPLLPPLLAHRSRLVRRALAQAQAIIVPTQFVGQTYADLAMPTEKLHIIPHGIDIPPFVQSAPRQAKPRPEPLHIIYVGSIAWQKGLHILIEAVNQLPPNKVKLSIFGDLHPFPDYVARLKAMITHPHIALPGRINRTDLWTLILNKADIAVLPALWHEVYALTIDEMFAGGVPTIASNIGSMPERIRDGVDGLLFPAGSAPALRAHLQRLLDDPTLLPHLRANIQPVRTIQTHLSQIDKIYATIQP